MPAVDELIELLRNVEKILYDRSEDMPKSIEVMIAYCEHDVKKNNFEIVHFNAYFENCRADLVTLSSSGYIWWSKDEKEQQLANIDLLAEKIRNPAAEAAQPKPKGIRRLLGLIARIKSKPKAEKSKPNRDSKGLGAYRIWCERLVKEFEQKFDPANPNSTRYVYQTAKRIERILQDPLSECLYSGAFHKRDSRLSGGDKAYKKRRKEIIDFLAGEAHDLIKSIDDNLSKIRSSVSAKVLSLPNNEILPLPSLPINEAMPPPPGSGQKRDDFAHFNFYQKHLQNIFTQIDILLYPIASIKVPEAIIMQDDLRNIRGIYWTLNTDRILWLAFYEDCISEDWEIYDLLAIVNCEFILYELTVKRICDIYERAFSTDHLSESDKGIAFVLGFQIDPADINAKFDAETTSIPEGFRDASSYFHELGIGSRDIDGKAEAEIKKLLKYRYYTLAKGCHPDQHPGDKMKEEQFKRLSEAYEVLSNPARRKEYLRT